MRNIITIISVLILATTAKAGTFHMVEINPKHGNSQDIFTDSAKNYYGAGNLKHFARLNGLLYFVGANEANNDELWVTDGTQGGTHIVKEINPSTGAGIGDLRVVGNKLMFLADESSTPTMQSYDYDLFVSDGTESGTMKIYELNQPYNTLLADQSAGIANNKLIFCTNTDVMVSDGSAAGSKSLAQINIVSYIGSNGYCEMNGNVFFIVNSDIWKSDGTPAGTAVVKSAANSANPWPLAYASYIKAFDNKLYIIGAKSGEGDDLYTFDGTENGTVSKLFNLPAGSNSYPSSMMVCGGSLWFSASDSISVSIYKVSSASAMPEKIAAAIGSLSYSNGKIYQQNMDRNGYDVIDAVSNAKSSFAMNGITLPVSGFSVTDNAVLCIGNKTVFQAYNSATNQQVLCITDGTSGGTRIEMPVNVSQEHPFDYIAGCGLIDVFDFTYYNDKLVIPANFNSAGRELWFYEENDMSTGITNEELLSGISLYPNPSNELLTVAVKEQDNTTGALSLQIMDMTGSIVRERVISTEKTEVPTSDLAGGTYIVTMRKGADVISRSKLSIAH